MRKPLSAMTLEELWQLFPIILTEHQPCWADWYAEEEAALKHILPASAVIHHIGSTAIPSIWAKPIVDMLVEVPQSISLTDMKELLHLAGFRCMSQSDDHLSFNKGYTEEGFAEKVFHLHLRRLGDDDELYFRDYLNAHPHVAADYQALKLHLWKEHEHNRDAYTQAKTDFVRKYTAIAKAKE